MTATQTQIRRDTESALNGATPALAELGYDTTNKRLRLGDGVTAGGIIVPNGFDIQNSAMSFGVAGGTANAITLTLNPAPLSYVQGFSFKFRATATNTGPVTIDINGLGVRDIEKISQGALTALEGGDLISGGLYDVIYDGFVFQLTTNTGITAVSQGDLNTSTGSGTIGSSGGDATLFHLGSYLLSDSVSSSYLSKIGFSSGDQYAVTVPGGQYGFYPQYRRTTSSGPRYFAFQQRYITSSPPYDMGDGEVGGFIFALVNQSGDIESSYIADAPPWAYNGPTDIRCTHKCPISGKKFKRSLKKRSFQEVMDGGKIEYELKEITHDIKNADMGLIPHPFGEIKPDQRVVILDPMSDKVRRMIDLTNNGYSEDVTEYVSNNIKIDNDTLSRKCPNGVIPCKFKVKKSG